MHPEQPGHTVGREAFDRIWHHSVLLLQRGFKEGGILTVDAEEAKTLGKPWTRRWAIHWNQDCQDLFTDCTAPLLSCRGEQRGPGQTRRMLGILLGN